MKYTCLWFFYEAGLADKMLTIARVGMQHQKRWETTEGTGSNLVTFALPFFLSVSLSFHLL